MDVLKARGKFLNEETPMKEGRRLEGALCKVFVIRLDGDFTTVENWMEFLEDFKNAESFFVRGHIPSLSGRQLVGEKGKGATVLVDNSAKLCIGSIALDEERLGWIREGQKDIGGDHGFCSAEGVRMIGFPIAGKGLGGDLGK